MHDRLSRLEYEIINETKCSEEPFSLLIACFSKQYGMDGVLDALIRLIDGGYINIYLNTKIIKVTKNDLKRYIKIRLNAKEKLEDYPTICQEYEFEATALGISLLEDEDKPI